MHSDKVAQLPVPRSLDAEQAVLGSLMLDQHVWPLVVDVVKAEYFRPDHQLIFAAIAKLHADSKAVDVVTVPQYLQRIGKLDRAGGLAYIGTLTRETPSAANVRTYAEAVRDAAIVRELQRIAARIARSTEDGWQGRPDELIAVATEQLIGLQAKARTGRGLVDSQQLAGELIDDLDRRREVPRGLAVGLADFDELCGGLEGGDLVVIAARPGVGKTSLLVTVAAEVATSGAVAVFSAEMPAQQLMRRAVALLGGISQGALRRPDNLTEVDWAAIAPAAARLAERQLWIDDTSLPPLAHIRAECSALKARAGGLRLVMIDYVQLVAGSGANRYEQLRDVSYGLKALAKDLGVAVIVLAQLNRGVESRERKRPQLSDLRDSGAIEEAADIVGMLYSEGYYNPGFPMPYVLECQVAKNRNGERGECLWRFDGEFSRVTVLEDGVRIQYRRERATLTRGGGGADL